MQEKINKIFKSYIKKFGYTPSSYEIYTMYTNGTLILTDKQENTIKEYLELNNLI